MNHREAGGLAFLPQPSACRKRVRLLSPLLLLLFFITSQVYSSSEFLAVQPTPTFAERSFSEDREEGWERSEGEYGHRQSTDVR